MNSFTKGNSLLTIWSSIDFAELLLVCCVMFRLVLVKLSSPPSPRSPALPLRDDWLHTRHSPQLPRLNLHLCRLFRA